MNVLVMGTIEMKILCSEKNESGSTLAEVSMAVTLLAVMAVALIGSFNYGFFVMGLARENQRATQILLEKAETIRLYSWEQVTNGISDTFVNYYDPQSTNRGVSYVGKVEIVPFPFPAASYANHVRQVNVTLTWTNSTKGIVRSRSLSTLTARYGMQNYIY